ncbi:lariat debranching enzyme [Exophiala xenobiotica]|nr:lariat debranching enzyme [Exophiala xenobiotica]KAK5280771.1 lariat debranching enzyme [Exophiala xenobiotica]KAK5386094.1 lariat debranching enzyme [Exophiala xenobiotica]KAK5400090.1 lariat debranching enzyme [Exophiala xenobiotica]KAK5414009.1 lariat debranching enzyme [Exophiala xenobiotica]
MAAESVAEQDGVRMAVEGCGHGTLHAIYASIEEACRVKGWDGIDLLIIGGDFQAVRNQHDLNVTSMPQKYRKMADFHEYYSGTRTAPYLTIFIGGNHEASNHLFELYYGGWVAPNIYYLGAANVIRLGPLRIAGLTGIWKGYDYRKPHFERLPYNREETGSIYHVRELDVRKLMALRSQVDIGLSHDWPQGIEMHGDYEWLFRNKKGFGEDSKNGKLGSVAARKCLDRLRPPYWFSAHLHTKFTAILNHDQEDSFRRMTENKLSGRRTPMSEDRPLVSAWQQFHDTAKRADAQEKEDFVLEKENQRLEAERTGAKPAVQYTFDETFSEIGAEDGVERKVISTTNHQVGSDGEEIHVPISNLDGCGFSRPTKRQRLNDGPEHSGSIPQQTYDTPTPPSGIQAGGNRGSIIAQPTNAINNPDAIDIDMSDDDEPAVSADKETITSKTDLLPIHALNARNTTSDDKLKPPLMSPTSSDRSDGGGVKLSPTAGSFASTPSVRIDRGAEKGSLAVSRNSSNASLLNEPAKRSEAQAPSTAAESVETIPTRSATAVAPESEVSEEMRAQLAALSSNFTQEEKVETSPALPFPEEILNKKTEFLALGKCEPYQEFLQLLEVKSITSPEEKITRPLKLSYDPEWLATLRTFASELQLGGAPNDRVPPHRGDTYYNDRIVEDSQWIDLHVVKPGKLQIPENFGLTAPIYDPSLEVGPNEMPREMTNPQTSAFCDLIGIENKFDIGEEERDFRMQQGPRPESAESIAYHSRPRGGGRGRGGHRGGGGGGGGGRGGRGGGRGRGRRW